VSSGIVLTRRQRSFLLNIAWGEHETHGGRNGILSLDDVNQVALDAGADALRRHDGRVEGGYSFLARAATWRIADAYRAAARTTPVSESSEDVLAARGGSPDPVGSRVVGRILVQELVAALPVKQRQVVFACYFVGLTQTQAAAYLGMNETAVASLRHRALERMRRNLEPAA
jgi:RNA polymerase sigma-70 factor, ECF subfamily